MKSRNNLILIVEDDFKFNRLIYKHLEKNNFKNVIPTYSGYECINYLNRNPEVLIIDYNLEENHKLMNGLQLAYKVKQEYPDVYTIMISGDYHNNTERFQDERFLNSIDKYIMKNVNSMSELIDSINEYLA